MNNRTKDQRDADQIDCELARLEARVGDRTHDKWTALYMAIKAARSPARSMMHKRDIEMTRRTMTMPGDERAAGGELQEAIVLANRVLDRPHGDPDDDLAVLSRQLLRCLERASGWRDIASARGMYWRGRGAQ